MKGFQPASRRIEVSVGESVRILRELQELSQNELSGLTGIPQSTISAIENDRCCASDSRKIVDSTTGQAVGPRDSSARTCMR